MPAVQFQVTTSEITKVEEKPLPPRPDATPIPPEDDWVLPVSTGDIVPKDGILFGEGKAKRAKEWQIGYDTIRGLYEADRDNWKQTRLIYEDRLTQANSEIKRLQPGWWTENKGTLGFVGGIIFGSLITVGVVYGVEQTR